MTTHRPSVTRGCRPSTFAGVVATLLIALVSYAVLLGSVQAAPDDAPGDTRPATAPAGGWADAYAALVRRADAGCPQAARQALEMVRHGPAVYGMHFPASPAQLRRWTLHSDCRDPPCTTWG